MNVIIKEDYQRMSQEAARIVAQQVIKKRDSVLGLPTGSTPIGMYNELVKLYKQGVVDFSEVVTFNLDEYYGLPSDHPGSFHQYMRENFFDHVNVREENIHIPDSTSKNTDKECERYEQEIARHGGIDLQVLGIGEDGHIGFNEPGTDWGTTTRLVNLSEETEGMPTKAITMGIKTIMRAQKLLLLASGRGKSEIVKEAIDGPITSDVPASILQLHPRVIVVLDKEAGSYILDKTLVKGVIDEKRLKLRESKPNQSKEVLEDD